jgi:hypothetical protein
MSLTDATQLHQYISSMERAHSEQIDELKLDLLVVENSAQRRLRWLEVHCDKIQTDLVESRRQTEFTEMRLRSKTAEVEQLEQWIRQRNSSSDNADRKSAMPRGGASAVTKTESVKSERVRKSRSSVSRIAKQEQHSDDDDDDDAPPPLSSGLRPSQNTQPSSPPLPQPRPRVIARPIRGEAAPAAAAPASRRQSSTEHRDRFGAAARIDALSTAPIVTSSSSSSSSSSISVNAMVDEDDDASADDSDPCSGDNADAAAAPDSECDPSSDDDADADGAASADSDPDPASDDDTDTSVTAAMEAVTNSNDDDETDSGAVSAGMEAGASSDDDDTDAGAGTGTDMEAGADDTSVTDREAGASSDDDIEADVADSVSSDDDATEEESDRPPSKRYVS